MKISDVLWKAANEHLWPGNVAYSWHTHNIYSCDAVLRAAGGVWRRRFLLELGCEPTGMWEFDEFKAGEERQGARYLWLMFAYLVAKDEGL